MFEVQKEIKIKFPELENLFNFKLKDDYIIYTSKNINKSTSEFIQQNINNMQATLYIDYIMKIK